MTISNKLRAGACGLYCFRVLLCVCLSLGIAGWSSAQDGNFNRIASFPTYWNNGERAKSETVAEIIAASDDGMTLIYTDSPLKAVGRIDLRDPRNPRPLGVTDVGGEPTSVTVIGNRGYVAVNTSKSFQEPSGKLLVVDLASGKIEASCELGGQPDSAAHDEAGTFVAVAIENERDEKAGNGKVPQLPGGWVVKVPLENGLPQSARMQKISVSGLAAIAPEDPEPEFLDVNNQGEIVVTLQENNHIVVINAAGKVASHFSAGQVDLQRVDTSDDGALKFVDSQPARSREPDSVQWLDEQHFLVCNEGDMEGGSRSITVFSRDGKVVFESNSDFETPIIQAGHYPDKRSKAKGVEPEGLAVGSFAGRQFAFVLAERASTMSVYDVTNPAQPVFKQLLPTGLGPEGAVAIPARNLVVVSSEVDLGKDDGVRPHVMIYEYQNAPAVYPQITSAGADRLIPWGAISGMVAGENGLLYFVSDSYYSNQPSIFTVDTKQSPARIISSLLVTRGGEPARNLDLEGVTLDGAGGFWVASEGRSDKDVPHALYHVDKQGKITEEVSLPAELLQHEIRYGFEGITRVGDRLWMAMQREWKDDPAGQVKLLAYDLKSKQWSAVRYPLHQPQAGWAGLSEIVAHGDYFYVVERDNLIGEAALTKKIFRIAAREMTPAPLGGSLPMVSKEEVDDLLSDLKGTGGYVAEKVEGLAIFADGTAWVSTDNDGVNDSNGETRFWAIGKLK